MSVLRTQDHLHDVICLAYELLPPLTDTKKVMQEDLPAGSEPSGAERQQFVSAGDLDAAVSRVLQRVKESADFSSEEEQQAVHDVSTAAWKAAIGIVFEKMVLLCKALREEEGEDEEEEDESGEDEDEEGEVQGAVRILSLLWGGGSEASPARIQQPCERVETSCQREIFQSRFFGFCECGDSRGTESCTFQGQDGALFT